MDLTKGPIAAPAPGGAPAPAQTSAPGRSLIPPPSGKKPTFTTVGNNVFDHGIKMCIYGRAGVGKTRFCATAPSPLIISAESGLLSLKQLYPNIPVAPVTTLQDVWDLYWWFKGGEAAAMGIKTACLDSVSEIIEKCLAVHKMKTPDPRQAYGKMADEALELVKAFRDLPGFHVIFTAKQATGKDPVTGVEKAEPTAPGQQVGQALPYLFDELFHAYTDKDGQGQTYHALRTRAAFNAEAKDRSGVLDEVEYPDASYLINKMLAADTAGEQPATMA